MIETRSIIAACLALLLALPVQAQDAATSGAVEPGYADLVDLAIAADLVIHAQIRKQTVVEPARAPGLAPGFARLYIEARTLSLIAGTVPLGESLNYLVDVPLDASGKVPKLKNQPVLLFARPVAGRAPSVQLVGGRGQMNHSPELEARVRPILADLLAPDSPPVIRGVSDALSVPGNLAGESETQIFLDTVDGSPVSISVLRRPGRPPVWGVSWGEIIDQAALPPRAGTLAWYRLACALPDRLPAKANLARDAAARTQAVRDYALVIEQLGPCGRTSGKSPSKPN